MAHMVCQQMSTVLCVMCSGHQDCGWQAGAGHWCCAAHHLHLLLPHGLQRKYISTSVQMSWPVRYLLALVP